MVGTKYSRLTLVSLYCRGKHQVWKCKCDCGVECTVRLDKLKAGRIKSCGCLREELEQAAKKARAIRIETDQRIIQEARFAKDELRLKSLLKKKGEINYRHFNVTGSPRSMAKEFREWAFLVAAVLWYGPTNDRITITADIEVNQENSEKI